jgi:hypothetical protein
VLDTGLDVDLALAAADRARKEVVHLVYPCVNVPPRSFEKFASEVGRGLTRARRAPPVLAAFHPELSGDAQEPHRLVGLLRRAPDPFVQLVPQGLHEGGTTFVGALSEAELAKFAAQKDPARENFDRLQRGKLDEVKALLSALQDDRVRAYTPHFAAMGLGGAERLR